LDFARYEDIVLTCIAAEILSEMSYRNGSTYFLLSEDFFLHGNNLIITSVFNDSDSDTSEVRSHATKRNTIHTYIHIHIHIHSPIQYPRK
jgi:hypothetical protein